MVGSVLAPGDFPRPEVLAELRSPDVAEGAHETIAHGPDSLQSAQPGAASQGQQDRLHVIV